MALATRVREDSQTYEPRWGEAVRAFTVADPIPAYGFFKWRHVLQRLFFKDVRGAGFVGELSYNPDYVHLMQEMKSTGFLTSYTLRRVYNDYPKLLSCLVEFTYGGAQEVAHAMSMVLPVEGLDVCFSKAIGEAIERHAARVGPHTYVPRIIHARAPFAYDDIPQFTPQQHALFPHFAASDADLDSLPSVRARNACSGALVQIPYHCVYYGIPQKDDVVIQQGTTNGCGGGFTYEQAAVAAVTELIERDALMLLWYSGRNPQIIDMSSGTGPYIDHIRSAQKDYGLEVYFLDTTYDTEVPSCICVIIDPVLNIVAMGGKASLSRDPLRGAYVEALTVLASSRGRIERGVQGNAFFKKNTFTDATMSQRERETQCCTPEGVAWVREHMLSGTSIPYGDFVRPLHTFDSEKEELTALVAKFRQLTRHYGDSYSLYLYEFDSKWTREYSYHVVRAFVPSFLKLHLKEHYATPYSKRLRRYMEHYGIPYEYERINTVPHFFP